MRRETVSAIRFGYGLAPDWAASTEPARLVADAEAAAKRRARMDSAKRVALIQDLRRAPRDKKKAARRAIMETAAEDIRQSLTEAVTGPGFGERLVAFWLDHFTVAANNPVLRVLVPDFVDTSIRPHINGRFPDMLRAAIKHPAMLIYLNQAQSIGPNSRAGKRRDRGLNENLAREVFELHTLGVDGSYDQSDVLGLAKLLTGLSVNQNGFTYRQAISEPGPHALLGQTYGGRAPKLADIESALDDIALHEETARHLSTKLQAHFIGQSFDDLTDKMAQAYRNADGRLSATYKTMLNDDRAWAGPLRKAKLPFGFIASSLRAAGATKSQIDSLSFRELRTGIVDSMQAMGQMLYVPPGPDGWDEAAETWITPPGLAARIRWSVGFAERIADDTDPRAFLESALADAATPLLTRAVAGAESRVEGIALTLVSPEFNRR